MGADDFGKQLEECASADGVKVHYMVDKDTPTGVHAHCSTHMCSRLIKEYCEHLHKQ